MIRKTRVFALCVAGLLVAASPLLAQTEPGAPDPEKLRQAAADFDEGTKLFKAKEYVEAAERFESADRLAPSPVALSNAIRARKSAKQLARAATLAAYAQQRYPDEASVKDLASQQIKAVEKQLYRANVTCAPACTLVVDGKVESVDAVAKWAIFLDPGPHTIVAGWSGGRSKTTKVDGKKGADEALSFAAPPEEKKPVASASASSPPPPPPPPPPSSATTTLDPSAGGLPPLVFYAGLGVTAVLTGITIWSGIDTQNNPGPDAVRNACAGKTVSQCPLIQDGRSRETRTNVLIGVTAGAAVLTGVVGIFFTDWKGGGDAKGEQARQSPSKVVLPTFGVGSGGRDVSIGAIGVF